MDALAIGLLCGLTPVVVILVLLACYCAYKKKFRKMPEDPETPRTSISDPVSSETGNERHFSTDSAFHSQRENRNSPIMSGVINPLHDISNVSYQNEGNRNPASSSSKSILQDPNANSTIPIRSPQTRGVKNYYVDSVYNISGMLSQEDVHVSHALEREFEKENFNPVYQQTETRITFDEFRRRREVNRSTKIPNTVFKLQQPTGFIVPLHNISNKSGQNEVNRNKESSSKSIFQDQNVNSAIPNSTTLTEGVENCRVYTISGNVVQEDLDESENEFEEEDTNPFYQLPNARVAVEEVRRRQELNRDNRDHNLNFIRQRELNCVLVIAADATPNAVGGYCVNLQENYCETYSLTTTQIPWKLVNPRDTSEFEMKNLMFAIMLWQKEIQQYKKFRIYTDNSAITSTKNKFGRVANKLLDHCTNCTNGNVRRINKNVYCNRGRDLNQFIQYIQPADDLSRSDQDSCEQFIKSYYGIPDENFKRSFMPHNRNHINSEFLQKMNSAINNWKIPCAKCGYSYRLGALNFIKASNWKNNNKTRRRKRY